jgi:hypothetical protein
MKAVVVLFFVAQLALTALATPIPNPQDLLRAICFTFLPTRYSMSLADLMN